MRSEKLTSCTVCGSNELSEYIECKDHFVSGEFFRVSICNSCGFAFTNPRPLLSDIAPYYDSAEYVSHSKTTAGMINRLFHIARMYTLAHKKRLLNKYSTGKSILDYGCGTGEFLEQMNKSGWSCFGIEPNTTAREAAGNKEGLIIRDESGLDEFRPSSISAISMWHVLEHVYPLRERLHSFHEILDREGTLFVALPNMQSYDAQHYGRFWAAWDLPRHVHHFNPSTIKTLMHNSGFKFIAAKPMLLDAFYISMLSEKYKHGSTRNFLALAYGLKSNLNAFFKDYNYSSLIYIFKKS